MRTRFVLLACIAFTLSAGCGGQGGCPALSLDMQSLAAQASAVEFDIYDASASCNGNDIAAGSPAPLVSRRVDGHGGTQLQLPAGHYVVVLHAFDASGAFIGSACQAELFTPGQQACLSISLSPPMADGDGGVIVPPIGGGGGGDMAVKQFVPQTSGVTTDLYQAWSPGGGVAYVVGVGGVILKTTDYGATWNKQNSTTTQDLEGVWGASATDVYVVGLHGTVLHTTNGGTSWSSTFPTSFALYDVWGASATDVYLVGDKGIVLHGSGSSFTTLSTPSAGTFLNCVWGAGASDIYIFGGNGLVMHGSAAAGFTKQTAPTGDPLHFGWGSSTSGEVWVPSTNLAGTSSTLWHSTDHGATFQSQLTTASTMWALWSTPAGDAILVGTSIEETNDHGAHWNTVTTPSALLFGIGGDPSGSDVWAVGTGGLILHR